MVRLRLQSLEVWRCCRSESEIAFVRAHGRLKKQQSYYWRRGRAGERKQGRRTNWIDVSLKVETGNNIPLKTVTETILTNRRKSRLTCSPVLVRPGQVPPVAAADLQRHGGGRRAGGTVLSCESDEVNIEVDLIGLA